MSATMNKRLLATIQCPDQPGLVAAIASTIHHLGGNIIDSDHHTDPAADWFVMRVESVFPDQGAMSGALRTALQPIAERYRMIVDACHKEYRPRVAILVSKQDHCLVDLLQRQRRHELAMDLVGIVSNHETCMEWARMFDVPYHYCPVTPDRKSAQERQIVGLLLEHKADLVIMARYMQILSAEFLTKVTSPVINIHHSFLPAFVGAKPYHQAYERGVKLIGATPIMPRPSSMKDRSLHRPPPE